MAKSTAPRLDEGDIVVSDKILASVSLSIDYTIGDSDYTIKTDNAGGGNYLVIIEHNPTRPGEVQLSNSKELFDMVNHFIESYTKLVPNSKL